MLVESIKITKENEYKSGVYCIENTIDERIYIGSTNCLKKRMSEHERKLKQGNHENIHLLRFVKKYGLKTLMFSIIEIVNDKNEMLKKEQLLLNNEKLNLFNICKQVSKPPKPNRSLTYDNILKIADLYNSGKTCSQISEILYRNREHRAKINLIVKGEQYTEYKHLFNYIKYSQKGRKRNKFSGVSKENREFIKNNIIEFSHRNIALILGLKRTTVYNYIKSIE